MLKMWRRIIERDTNTVASCVNKNLKGDLS